MVGPDRPTQSGAELLQSIFRFRKAVCLIDCVVGSRRGVPVVIERAAVERVASRPGYGVDEARSTSIDGRVGADRDLELLDRVLAVQVGNAVTADDVGKEVAGGIGSVHGERIRAISIGVSGVLAALLSGDTDQTGIAVIAGIRRQSREAGVTAPVKRQFLNQRSLKHRGGGRFRWPQQWRRPDYFDCVGA